MMQAKERWEIDGSRSQLSFSLRHIVVSEIQGWFRNWGGEMIFDPDDPALTQIRIWIDTASIETGSAERDEHVRSAEFLDVARFPRAEFTATEVAPRGDGQATVTGRLLLHGVGRLVDVDVVAQRTWVDGNGVMRAAYTARAKIDRQAFQLHWNQDLDVGGIVVGDRVEIQARIEMVRTADADFARDPSAGADRPAARRA